MLAGFAQPLGVVSACIRPKPAVENALAVELSPTRRCIIAATAIGIRRRFTPR